MSTEIVRQVSIESNQNEAAYLMQAQKVVNDVKLPDSIELVEQKSNKG